MAEYVLGIDVGGTSIKAGLFTPSGELLEERKIPTPALVDETGFTTLTGGISRILKGHDAVAEDVIACGLDIPAPVAADGSVSMTANVELDPDGLVHALTDALPLAKIAFVNDGSAAALGEMWRGSARGVSDFVMIAIGTGVGAGIISNGQLVAGAFGNGGEIGHITVNMDETRECGCGRKGCLEQYASAKGIVRLYLEECKARGVTPAEVEHATDTLTVFNSLAEGDDCARKAVHQMCEYLGYAMAQISCVVDPKLYLIGGGVAGGFAFFADELRACFRKNALKGCKDARIEAASLGNQAAMYGCAYEALRLYKSHQQASE